jgi:hypothetical protein
LQQRKVKLFCYAVLIYQCKQVIAKNAEITAARCIFFAAHRPITFTVSDSDLANPPVSSGIQEYWHPQESESPLLHPIHAADFATAKSTP